MAKGRGYCVIHPSHSYFLRFGGCESHDPNVQEESLLMPMTARKKKRRTVRKTAAKGAARKTKRRKKRKAKK